MGEFFVYSFFFGTLLMLFPVFVDADIYLDARENRGWFSLSLYHFFRVFGGYAQLRGEGIVFHLSKKKAIILPYGEMSNARKKFEITKGFQLMRFHQLLESGGAQDAKSILLAAGLSAVGGAAYAFLKESNAALSFRSRVIFYNRPCLKASLGVTAVMNGLVITIALTKKTMEGFLKWMRKRRSTVSLRKLRKNLRASSM